MKSLLLILFAGNLLFFTPDICVSASDSGSDMDLESDSDEDEKPYVFALPGSHIALQALLPEILDEQEERSVGFAFHIFKQGQYIGDITYILILEGWQTEMGPLTWKANMYFPRDIGIDDGSPDASILLNTVMARILNSPMPITTIKIGTIFAGVHGETTSLQNTFLDWMRNHGFIFSDMVFQNGMTRIFHIANKDDVVLFDYDPFVESKPQPFPT